MKQAMIDKWIDIFKHYNPDVRVRYCCKLIDISSSSFIRRRKYSLSLPNLAEYIRLECNEMICKDVDEYSPGLAPCIAC